MYAIKEKEKKQITIYTKSMNFNLIVEVFGDTRENVGLNATSVAPAVVAPRPRARGPGPRV